MGPLDQISRMLGACGSDQAVLPPTALYNEGWMLRLVLGWYEANAGEPGLIRFEPGSRWYSEALLGSRFFGTHRGDTRAEGWTHADGVIGHFRLCPGGRGDIELLPDARQLTVTEAKMGSLLSAGTKNAPKFDQAARNLACIAQQLALAKREPIDFTRIEFLVLAPESRIETGAFAQQLDKDNLRRVVTARASAFGEAHVDWLKRWFEPTLSTCVVKAIAWEHLLAEISWQDPPVGDGLAAFYKQCLIHNPMVYSHT